MYLSSVDNRRANPPGFVPEFGQGLQALPVQPGTLGGKRWLKKHKLHKYWPMFSHWSYEQFISLREENIDYEIEKLGSTGMTNGAKGKFLRCIDSLNERESVLKGVQAAVKRQQLNIPSALNCLKNIVETPLPTDPENEFCSTLIATISDVNTYILNRNCPEWICNKMCSIIREVATIPVVQKPRHNMLRNKVPKVALKQFVRNQNIEANFSQRMLESQSVRKQNHNENTEAKFRQRIPTTDSGFEESYSGCSKSEEHYKARGTNSLFKDQDYSQKDLINFIDKKYLSEDGKKVVSEPLVTYTPKTFSGAYQKYSQRDPMSNNSTHHPKGNDQITNYYDPKNIININNPYYNFRYSRFEGGSSLKKLYSTNFSSVSQKPWQSSPSMQNDYFSRKNGNPIFLHVHPSNLHSLQNQFYRSPVDTIGLTPKNYVSENFLPPKRVPQYILDDNISKPVRSHDSLNPYQKSSNSIYSSRHARNFQNDFSSGTISGIGEDMAPNDSTSKLVSDMLEFVLQ